MYQYELPKYIPTADELPCSDDTPVGNELQELIPSLLKSREWLYWYDENNSRYPTPYERAKLESQRADLASQRADRLAAQLRALGIEPEVPSTQ
ncbi:hypothetical protein [Chamaesiphon sp. OTE_75_metabat_556]|uniref:hypothetical protein n=1 Tax=Chamaesiphon sp. OTE_75_metabat_556 TaxID=2964692 RepID=UPI00286AD4E6|nr:hypothetical protein [Chamaesiphon sp. OTE_75_metabat_556]